MLPLLYVNLTEAIYLNNGFAFTNNVNKTIYKTNIKNIGTKVFVDVRCTFAASFILF